MTKNIGKDGFIQRAVKTHGNLYDYSKTVYTTSSEKLNIICPKPGHGMFSQKANNHLMGAGCPKCAKEKRAVGIKNTNDFIAKAIEAHGEVYDYKKSIYVNAKTKIRISCPTHGEFLQLAGNHLKGSGCKKCGDIKKGIPQRGSREDFIRKSLEKHGSKYDYSQVIYKNSITKVDIGCPIHGVYRQSPEKHWSGCGCPKCGLMSVSKKKKSNTEKFIEKSIKVHGKKYDYSLARYKTCFEEVEIICDVHGKFWQVASNHLSGRGCPACAKHGFDGNRQGKLYLLQFQKPYLLFWKIGVTHRSAKERCGGDFQYVKQKWEWEGIGNVIFDIEQNVLKEFSDYKIENFLFPLLGQGGDTECFNHKLPPKKVIEFIESQLNQSPMPVPR